MKRKSFTKNQRTAILEKTDGHCAYCGIELELKDMQVDHIVSVEHAHFLREAGIDGNDMQNLFPACRSCNYIKSCMNLEKFRIYIERLPATLFRDSVTFRNALRFGMIEDNGTKCVFYFEKIGLETPKNTMDEIYIAQHEKIWEKIDGSHV